MYRIVLTSLLVAVDHASNDSVGFRQASIMILISSATTAP